MNIFAGDTKSYGTPGEEPQQDVDNSLPHPPAPTPIPASRLLNTSRGVKEQPGQLKTRFVFRIGEEGFWFWCYKLFARWTAILCLLSICTSIYLSIDR